METEEILEPQAEETPAQPAETEGESGTPETEFEGEEAAAEPEKPVKGVQKRIDELVKQREDERRDKEYWRQMALQAQPPAPPAPAPGPETFLDLPKPKSDDFETYDEYVEALADWKTEVKWRQNQRKQEDDTLRHKIVNWQEQGKGKYSDWQSVFHNDLAISPTMAEILLESEAGHDIAYYLGQNPAEASRIYGLPGHLQGREIGKLEAKLGHSIPPQRDTTKAPSPTAPVGGKETPSRKPEDMSYDEYKKWREAGGGRT